MLLPDGEEFTEGRKNTLLRGYDHYWRFHKDEEQWIEFCPICELKHNNALEMDADKPHHSA